MNKQIWQKFCFVFFFVFIRNLFLFLKEFLFSIICDFMNTCQLDSYVHPSIYDRDVTIDEYENKQISFATRETDTID